MYKLEWCRKAKYYVQIELGCYELDEEHPLLEGFEVVDKIKGFWILKGCLK